MERDEIDQLASEIEAVLEYASSLQAIAQSVGSVEEELVCRNVMRDDVVIEDDREALLDQAPEREGDYFVVPKIIKQK